MHYIIYIHNIFSSTRLHVTRNKQPFSADQHNAPFGWQLRGICKEAGAYCNSFQPLLLRLYFVMQTLMQPRRDEFAQCSFSACRQRLNQFSSFMSWWQRGFVIREHKLPIYQLKAACLDLCERHTCQVSCRRALLLYLLKTFHFYCSGETLVCVCLSTYTHTRS